MNAKEFVKDLASILEDDEILHFQWKIRRDYTLEYMTNKTLSYLKWFRNQQDDSDFDQEEINIDGFYFTDEIDFHKIIIDNFRYSNQNYRKKK